MKVNHENAPHLLVLSVEIKVCEMKNTGELVPATKNMPLITKIKYSCLADAKVAEEKALESIKGNMGELFKQLMVEKQENGESNDK